MSSQEEDYNDGGHPTLPESKKRRVQRACDICRRKKIRCDGSQMPGNKCSNCIAYSFECTYLEVARKRGPPKGYVESLENRLEKMEKLLQKVCPDADFTQELGGGRIDRDSWTKGTNNTSPSLFAQTSIEDVVQEDEDSIASTLGENFASLTMHPNSMRYFGKSSGPMLIQKAIDLKMEYNGDDIPGTERLKEAVRPELRTINPWEERAMTMTDPEFEFPDDDLGLALVDLYFAHMNHLLPLLHRPTFEQKLRARHHLRDHAFGSVYLLVCANGSRYSHDPRVFVEGGFSHSAGWKYFEQVPVIRKTLLAPPALEDLQVYCLASIYLQGTSAPQACWTIVGIGIRLAQDVGAHRKKVYNTALTVDGELWKRAFWALVTVDRVTSVSLGRPCAIQEEDFDIDLPVECDDEYWEHPDPELAFKQPENKPCTISFFINYLKLYHIQAFALRTIYSISKHKVVFGSKGPQWEERVVAELDSAMNKWVDAVPDHLRWDPNRDVSIPFFSQSCVLYASYYQLQILIHRPFIPSPRRPSVLSFPSLAICTNAARSCSHVLDIYRRRSNIPHPYLTMPAFTAGIVLLLNIWGGKRSGLSTDPAKEMADVHKCMAFLQMCEERWHSAGRLRDVLCELASAGDLPPPQPSPTGGVKRERDSDSASPCSTHSSAQSHDGPRMIAGSRRVHRTGSPTSRHYAAPVANLPVYSNDLGRLPVHGHVNFSVPGLQTHAPHGHPDSSAGMWYPQHTTHHHAPPDHHVGSAEHPSTQYGVSGAGPYPPALPSHGPPASYPLNDHLYGDSTGGFTYDVSRHHPPSPPSGFYEGDGCRGDSTSGYHMDLDASNIHHPQGHAQHRPSLLQPPILGQVAGGNSHHAMDQDTIAMWSTAPSGFEVSDWGMYINNVSGVASTHAPMSRHDHRCLDRSLTLAE
ncbi:fungal-specific transcription factor domain-containing protein [Pisolithus tinctorius]|uniref:Zn(2)-C6 fungal-type domain-containing protein n=1 Tax=Pisolithus tinctorius Marx 270 TaxID=870435 RepID=A0A0C3NAK8_PISTI|nr:fungal-specific transcription factor domain-containing protein [Pisolithus tinctorius]KIN98134.1 hypothetical protein M404DRAFT_1005658 [Pisolithus tinctorius Marx 270]